MVCQLVFGPFLNTGTIEGSFQSDGTSPLFKDVWYSLVSIGASDSAAAFSMKAGMESGPVAFWQFMDQHSKKYY